MLMRGDGIRDLLSPLGTGAYALLIDPDLVAIAFKRLFDKPHQVLRDVVILSALTPMGIRQKNGLMGV